MPNADIIMKRGQLANLSMQPIKDGTIYVTTDEGAMYVDVGNSRIRLGDFVPVDTLTALQNITDVSEKAMYYVKEGNILARWDADTANGGANPHWIQINKAGIVNVRIDGAGNAISDITTTTDEYGRLTLVVTKTNITGGGGTGVPDSVYQDIDDLKQAVRTLNGSASTIGSVAKAVADAKAALLGNPTTYTTIEALETALAGVKTTAEAADALSKSNKSALDALTITANTNADDITSLKSTIGSSDSAGLRKRIKDLEDALAVLNDSDPTTDGSIKHAVAEGVASIVANADARYDTLKEIADWIINDTTGSAALSNAVQQATSDITALQGRMTTAENKLTGLMADANTEGSIDYKIAAEASARATEDTRLAGLISENSDAINQANTDITSIKNTLTWREF